MPDPIQVAKPDPLPSPSAYHTAPDPFGLWHVYSQGQPSFTPDIYFSLEHIINNPESAQFPLPEPDTPSLLPSPATDNEPKPVYYPFKNSTTYNLVQWYHKGSSTKSISQVNSLVKNVIQAPEFDVTHLKNFEALREIKHLDAHLAGTLDQSTSTDDGGFFTGK